MHPVNQVFEDIFRHYWGIPPATERPERQRLAKPAKRNWRLLVGLEGRQD